MHARPFAALLLVSSTSFAASAGAQTTDHWPVDSYEDPAPPSTAPRDPPVPILPDVPSAPFGTRGQWVIDGSADLGLHSTSYDASAASSFAVGVSSGLHYFVATDVSVGLDLGVSYSDGKGYGADGSLVETTSTSVSVGPRVGYVVHLGRAFSFWPQAAVGFESTHTRLQLVSGSSVSTSGSPLGNPTTTYLGPWVSGYAPLVLHATPRFFVGAGPTIFHEFSHAGGGPDVGGQRTSVGGNVLVGGYWGGPAPVAAVEEPVAKPEGRHRRFGDAGTVAFTNALGASVRSTTFAGASSSWTSASIDLAVEWFVADHVSLGASLTGRVSSTTGIDPVTRAEVDFSTSSYGIAPRIGFDVPISEMLSFYPRFYLGFAHGSGDESSAGKENKYDYDQWYVTAYAPLLVHPAPHVFFGAGPSFSHDLDLTYSSGGENRGTTVGIGATVGGWL